MRLCIVCQGELLTAERMLQSGGVLLRDLPLLTGQNPQVVMVQPRDLIEGWRQNEKKRRSRKLGKVGKDGSVTSSRVKTANTLHSISISPDFSKFVEQPQKEERYRGGHRDDSNMMDLDQLPGMTRKPSWNFESIIKEIEEDSILIHSSSSSTSTEPCDALPGLPDGFTDIPLEPCDVPVDVEERQTMETQEALTRLFDQLLTDIYSHNLSPWRHSEKPGRRRSDSILPHFHQRDSFDNQLNRQMSFPGALSANMRKARRFRHSLPVRCLSGIDRSSFTSLTRMDPALEVFTEEEPVLCENKLVLLTSSKIQDIKSELESNVAMAGKLLVVELEEKDELTFEQSGLCEIVTASLQAISNKTSDDARVKFSLTPATHDQSGFQEWARAMRMVARLPDGVPAHFRKNLWLSLAERHLHTKGVSWVQTERRLFSETNSTEDKELSVQIVKDLHRTGCSLFCGVTGQHNQAVLKRVLVAYARWNANVGYCQGLNMLAALILQVMQGSQSATVKVMIYLIEGVLPESYFANNLRGLSVDMAVFRDLLRLKLPELSKHLDHLQQDSKDSGTSYEPPLCDVFTMQWFLTLFSNCLPQNTVLRVWDLVFLEGDQILLRTALAIWQSLSDRMMSVRSADEFYSIMAVLTREMMEFGLMEPNSLIKAIDNMNIPEVGDLREKYIYNISPWAVGTVAKMGVKLLYPDHGSPNHEDSRDNRDQKLTPFSNHPDREKIALDISALKRQYWKLRERQRQAHIILSACRSENLTTGSSPALNHLLLGKRALLSAKGRRIEGSVPQNRIPPVQTESQRKEGQTITWREARGRSRKGAVSSRSPTPSSSSSSSSTELCDSSDSEEDKSEGEPRLTDSGSIQARVDSPPGQGLQLKTECSSKVSPDSGHDAIRQDIGGNFAQRVTPDSSTTVDNEMTQRLSMVDLHSNKSSESTTKTSQDVAADKIEENISRVSTLEPEETKEGDGNAASSALEIDWLSGAAGSNYSLDATISEAYLKSTGWASDKHGSSLSSITRMGSSELAPTSSAHKEAKELRKAPSSSQLGNMENKWSRPPISSYSSIQLGVAEQSKVPSSSFSSTQLGSGESSSTYSSLSSLPKDDTLSSDWGRQAGDDIAATSDKRGIAGDSRSTSPEKTTTVEEKVKRRKSEIALLQILQENSQILQRIHQAHKIASPDEPEDIKEIRRRYGYRQSSSLDSPKTPKSADVVNPFRRTPSTLSRDVTIKLGMYPDRT